MMDGGLPNPEPPFAVRAPAAQTAPLLLASPHSGRDYTPDFIAAARLDQATLRRSEDSFVDELFAAAPSLGIPLLEARFPRAFCDVNREPWELDPLMFEDTLPSWVNTTSPRVGAGLGTIARIAANGEAIYNIRLPFAEAERRIRTCWQPYHDALAALLAETKSRFGVALLLDCHSMPSHAVANRTPAPDIVLGDAYGQACAPTFIRAAELWLKSRGYRTTRNDPYAGGYVTRHYGRPRENIHVLQLEIARPLYMNEASIEKNEGFARVLRDMTDFTAMLAVAASEWARG